jgi:hypothetical protein
MDRSTDQDYPSQSAHDGNRGDQGIGGAECLFDRLLCVRDDKRTPSEESNAHNLALKRDKYEDMAEFPKSLRDQYSPAAYSCQGTHRPTNRRMMRDG